VIFLVWLAGVHLRMPATLPAAAGVTGRSVFDTDPVLLALEVLTAVVDGAAPAVLPLQGAENRRGVLRLAVVRGCFRRGGPYQLLLPVAVPIP